MRGGKREGAGRKPRSSPLKAITLRVSDDVAEAFDDEKARLQLSGPELLAALLKLSRPRRKRKSENDQADPLYGRGKTQPEKQDAES